MTRTASGMTVSSSLIEDYLSVMTPPVASELTDKFIVVTNQVKGVLVNELLTVGHDNTSVLHFVRDQTSHSGWNQNLVPIPIMVPNPISTLLGFYEQGVLNVLVFYPAASGSSTQAVIWMQRSSEGYWNSMPSPPGILSMTTQADVYRDPNGNHFLYGISVTKAQPTFFLISRNESTDLWTQNFEMDTASTTPAYLVVIGLESTQLTILQPITSAEGTTVNYRCGSIEDGVFQWAANSQWKNFSLATGPLTITRFHGLPATVGQSAFLVRINNDQLFYVGDFSAEAPTTSDLLATGTAPTGVQSLALGVDGRNRYMVFALDLQGQLWLLRQTETESSGNPVFNQNWVPLGNALKVIACPTVMPLGPEVFNVSLTEVVQHLSQKLVTHGESSMYGSWFVQQLDGPTPPAQAPQPVSTYSTEIVAVDQYGSPVPSVVMNIMADRSTVIIANELAYHVSPQESAQIVTNTLGKLTVAIRAISLTAPVLSINVPDFMSSGEWKACPADEGTLSRLAGQDPSLPVTGASLENAGVLPSGYPDADTVASTVRTAGQLMLQKRTAPSAHFDLSKLDMPHWELDFTAEGGPRIRPLSLEEAQDRIRSHADLEADFTFSDFWGDVANFFKHMFKDIVQILHTVENDVVNVTIYFGKVFKKFVLQTVDDIGDFLEVLVNYIKKAIHVIKEVITFLRELFEWSDILNTHTVIKYYINSVMTNLQTSDQDAVCLIKEKFAALQSEVQSAFTNAEQVFESGLSFNQYASKQKGGSSTVLQGQPYHDTFHAHAARCNYVSSKAQHHFATTSSLAAALPPLADTSPFDSLYNLVQAQASEFQAKTQSLQNFLQIQTSNPKEFFDVAMLAFLQAAEDVVVFVLDIVEDILLALLDLLGTAISTLQAALNKTINIPILSWLYKYVITGTTENPGDDLTILDVLSLILAVPATILYKLLFGTKSDPAKPSPPFTSTQVTTITSSPIPWPSFGTGDTEAPPKGGLTTAELTSLQEVMLLLAGISYFLYTADDLANDGLAALSEGEEDPIATFLSWSGIVLILMFQGFTVPYQVLEKSPSDWSKADTATVTYWGAGFVPVALNLAFTIYSSVKANCKYAPVVGPITLSVAGTGLLATGIWATVEQAKDASYQNGWTEVANIMAPIPTSCAWLLPLKDVTEGISVAFLLALAAICDFGTLVTTIASVASDSSTT